MSFKVIDQKTGLQIREASIIEAIEFCAANPSRTWEKATMVSTGVLVDTDYGPGIWFGGAGF